MASYREMNALAKDPARVRSLAESLLAVNGAELTDWEQTFLGDLKWLDGNEALTTRQAEKLVEIREDNEWVTQIDSYSVANLFKNCFQARLDLSEDDEAFLMRMRELGHTSRMRRREARWLLRCARQLHLIDGYVDFD